MKFRRRKQRKVAIIIMLFCLIVTSVAVNRVDVLAAELVKGFTLPEVLSITEEEVNIFEASDTVTKSAIVTPGPRPTETPKVTPTTQPNSITVTRPAITVTRPAVTSTKSAITKKHHKKKLHKKKHHKKKEKLAIKCVYNTSQLGSNHKRKSLLPHTRQSGLRMFGASTPQQHLQNQSRTGKYGARMYKDRYIVALGSYYTSTIGQYFDLVMENGTVLKCVLGDQKADRDTDATHRYHRSDGSIAEFVIDRHQISRSAMRDGDMSSASKEFKGNINKIILYKKIAKF